MPNGCTDLFIYDSFTIFSVIGTTYFPYTGECWLQTNCTDVAANGGSNFMLRLCSDG